MPVNEVNGLPAHVLLVHAVLALVPLGAALAVVVAWWPRWRRRLGVLPPVVALGALVVVPLATNAGEWLRDRVGATPLVVRHAELGSQLLPWTFAVFLLSLVGWLAHRRSGTTRPVLRVVAGLVMTAVSMGAVVQLYRVGDSGARAVWQGSFSEQRLH